MNSFSSLPRTLLALSLITLTTLPVLVAASPLPPTSLNDQFRAIAIVHRTQQPKPPLCCLKPLPTGDAPDGPEDVLLSFEEWKSKQLHAASPTDLAKSKVETSADSGTPSNTNTNIQNADVPPTDAPSSSDMSYSASDNALPPHFRVPITDRFNYANMDCSARVHTSHTSARSASSILSSKKDKYMLSPCSADAQFVVVELCDDIRIDTVQLANFEFFSGVFKDFSVSVAKTYTGTNEGWTPAGTYRAKNIRGVQSFHPPTSLRDFYRYIRIDFHSHYGHEYYCPVSLLRVYGFTHLEEWKWDMWQSESRARLKESAAQRALIGEHTGDATSPKVASNSSTNVSVTSLGGAETRSHATSQTSSVEAASTPTRETPSTHSQSRRSSSAHVPDEETPTAGGSGGEQQTLATPSTGVHSVTEAISSLLSMSSPGSGGSSTLPIVEHVHVHSHDSEIHAFTTLSPQPSNSPTPLVQAQWSGESIYRTIMNRLTTLEANHTLYARYVEEQTAGVREVLRKLNEEVGRLESVSRMQAQMYQRTVHEWERQRLRLELEHGELLSRVNYLSEEVVLEKRLSIAQLCLLLAVLVFIGLTRGAPAAQHPSPALHRSRRELGVHNLSFGSSTEGWNPLRQRSLSPAEQSGSTKAEKATATDDRPQFQSTGSLDWKAEPHAHHTEHATRAFKLTTSAHKRTHVSSAFRTPTKPRPLMLIEPHTLPRAEPLTRSHSSSTSGHPQARSMKRWARTAHLHEIKVSRERRGSGGSGSGIGVGSESGKRVGYKDRDRDREKEHELGDVFGSPSVSPTRGKARRRRPVVPFRAHSESTDGDAWIDTDVDVEEEEEEDGSVGSERVVVLNSPDRDVFG